MGIKRVQLKKKVNKVCSNHKVGHTCSAFSFLMGGVVGHER